MSSTAPPPPPVSGGNAKYVVVIALLVLALVGLFMWRNSHKDDTGPVTVQPVVDAAPVATNHREEEEYIPPPDIPEAGPDTGTPKSTGTFNPCAVTSCSGKASSEFESALAFRARNAKKCYESALAQDPTLQGRVSIRVRVASNGQVCSASVAKNDLGNSAVAQCAANVLRTGGFPAPKGGCVDVEVPLSFVPGKR